MSTEQWKAENQEPMRKYRRDWYARNRQDSISTVKKRSQELLRWFRDYKSACSCRICGETHPACLTFHHRDASDKLIEVSILVKNHCSREKILAEIQKCDVMCANCHAKLHWSHLYEREEYVDGEENPASVAKQTGI